LKRQGSADWVADLGAARAGSVEAYGRIISNFQDMAFAVALARLSDPWAAEDMTQEAFIEAFMDLRNLKDLRAFPGWFRTIVERQCSRWLRAEKEPVAVDPDMGASDESPQRELELSEFKVNFMNVLNDVPEHERIVILMHYVGDYSQRDIASFLELPITTIKKRLHDGKSRLRRLLVERATTQIHAFRPSANNRLKDMVEFSAACIAGDETRVRALLRDHPELVATYGEVEEPKMRRIGAHWGWPPLHLAAHYGHLNVVAALVENSAPLERSSLNSIGNTAVGAAVWGNRLDVVRYLVGKGARLDARNRFGQSPLHRAVWRGAAEIAEFLIDAGADESARDPDGRTPAEVAEKLGNAEMLRVFRKTAEGAKSGGSVNADARPAGPARAVEHE
jgi:RNA polymerase sigma factor (sigma-70 family)